VLYRDPKVAELAEQLIESSRGEISFLTNLTLEQNIEIEEQRQEIASQKV